MFHTTPGRRLHRATRGASLATLALAVFVTSALATGGSGFRLSVQARGATAGAMQFNVDQIKLQAKSAVDFVSASLVVDPLGHSGWHSHPGLVLVTVMSGELTLYSADCSSAVYGPGTSFVEAEGSTHLARNESATVPVLATATFIVAAGTPALRIDEPDPGCPLS